jgi:hypothetical protein
MTDIMTLQNIDLSSWDTSIVPSILTWTLDGGEGSTSRLGPFITLEKAPSTHWIGGWVGPRAGLTLWSREILFPGIEPQPSSP